MICVWTSRRVIALIAITLLYASEVRSENTTSLACMFDPCEVVQEYELPPLGYPYDSLEPHIDNQTMNFHHDVHFAGYTRKMNAALKTLQENNLLNETMNVESILGMLNTIDIDPDVKTALINNGGGYLNHKMYFDTMNPEGQREPSKDSPLAEAIDKQFGSFKKFQEEMTQNASSVFGSGWSQLAMNPSTGELMIKSYPNQNSPYLEGLLALLGLDVWEHSYYLKYGPKRADYIKNWWEVVDFKPVEDAYDKAMQASK